jgi:hypothetical protein
MSLQPKQQLFTPRPGYVVVVTAVGEYSSQQHGVGVVGEVVEVEPSKAFQGWLSVVLRRSNGLDFVCAQCRVQLARAGAGRAA